MSEDLELRHSVIKLIRAVVSLHSAVAEIAPMDASVQEHLKDSVQAIGDALRELEVGLHERSQPAS
jgi:hypothetical protein